MMMIAPSVYRPTFKICKEGGKLLVQSRIRKGFPVEFETYFSLTSDIFHGIWALCSFHKIHPASKEGSDFWVKTVIIAFLKISSNYAMTYFCRGSHHGSQIGQSRNSVKFASPTHHRYSAASDNLGKEKNKIIVIINDCDALMLRSHPEMVQLLFWSEIQKCTLSPQWACQAVHFTITSVPSPPKSMDSKICYSGKFFSRQSMICGFSLQLCDWWSFTVWQLCDWWKSGAIHLRLGVSPGSNNFVNAKIQNNTEAWRLERWSQPHYR